MICILHTVRHIGLLIPTDIFVVGFDSIPMAAHLCPPSETTDTPKRRIGRRSIGTPDMLMKNADNGIGSIIIKGSFWYVEPLDRRLYGHSLN